MARTLEDLRFYAILDADYVPRSQWISTYRALIHGGADLVQIRAKSESHEDRVLLLEALLPDIAAAGRPLIMNDDLEAAACYPGMNIGLHLGQEDESPLQARARLGDGPIIGQSTHSLSQAEQAMELGRDGILSYFAVGPLFQTPTKPDYEPVGLDLARKVKALNPPIPFFVIGGITRQTIGKVVAAGIERIVVVSDVLKADDPAEVIRELKAQLPGAV